MRESLVVQTSTSFQKRLADRSNVQAWVRLERIYSSFVRRWICRTPVPDADIDEIVQGILQLAVRRLLHQDPNHPAASFRDCVRFAYAQKIYAYWRAHPNPPPGAGPALLEMLTELKKPGSALCRTWQEEHNQHVVSRILELTKEEFDTATWRAFVRFALDENPLDRVAAELGLSDQAVLAAESRVLRRLRREAQGLIC
jgi:hypothetical protein